MSERALWTWLVIGALASLLVTYQINEDEGRPYTIWVWGNLRDFFFGVGVCQAVVFCAAFVDGFRDGDSWREALTRPITLLCIGALAVLLAIDALGMNRGEVIRLWIFLACFFQIPTAYVCARLDKPLALMLVIAVTVLQAAVGTAMVGVILPSFTPRLREASPLPTPRDRRPSH